MLNKPLSESESDRAGFLYDNGNDNILLLKYVDHK